MRLGSFVLDLDRRELMQNEKAVHIPPKAFSLLELLAQKSPAALSKDQIHELLWPGEFVEDGSLHNLVSEIRRILGDERTLLRTVPRFGYALTLDRERSSAPVSRFCLVAGDTVFALRIGDNILGRGADVDVPVEMSGVSRHHARLFVTPAAVQLEDLSSKNGTFVGKNRVTGPTRLRDGDQLFLGRAMLTFRIDRRVLTTATEPPP